jgi:hypothetical protein
MRVNANAASYIIYITPVLGAFNVAKLLNKMQQKLLLGVPDRDHALTVRRLLRGGRLPQPAIAYTMDLNPHGTRMD